MSLVILLRGVNVGGHRTFRPSQLATALRRFDVVNIGAAGTFVAHAPVTQAVLRAEIARRLPFETQIMICAAKDMLRAAKVSPFTADAPSDIIQFVSLLGKRSAARAVPFNVPPHGRWSMKILAQEGRFVFGVHRRDMMAIGELGKLDRMFGVPVTTRSWTTVQTIVRLLAAR